MGGIFEKFNVFCVFVLIDSDKKACESDTFRGPTFIVSCVILHQILKIVHHVFLEEILIDIGFLLHILNLIAAGLETEVCLFMALKFFVFFRS